MQHLPGILRLSRMRQLRFVVFAGACLVLLADASAGERSASAPGRSPIRSAELLVREGQWQRVSPRSADEERAEIRAHFGAVRGILERSTPFSLGIAVARFERAFHVSLTLERRQELLSRLAERREVQIERLLAYARAGRFPLNRHYPGEARPIFVDAQGTRCAVGHLMALDGWASQVDAIARAKPNVLVREVNEGPLVSWVLTSGLIQEEAALIQPTYFPPPAADATKLDSLVVPGASLERDGFRYENFGFSAASTGGATAPGAAQFDVVYGWPPVPIVPTFCTSLNAGCVPRQDTLWFGFNAPSPGPFELITSANQSISVNIDYDVRPLNPGLAIGGTESFASIYYGGAPPRQPSSPYLDDSRQRHFRPASTRADCPIPSQRNRR